MSGWAEDPEYHGDIRGRGGFDGRRLISKQQHYENVAAIRKYLFRLLVIGGFVFFIFIAAVGALLYFSFELAAHRSTLESIENKMEEALAFLMQVLNSTSQVTKDITTAYSRAKMAHRRSVGSISDDEYNQYLQTNGMNTPVLSDNPFAGVDHDNETYVTHFMHIIMRSIPLEDEEAMVIRFRNVFNGIDAFMYMLGEANRTRMVQNASLIENKINDIIYAPKTHKLAIQGANFASDAMTHSQVIIDKYMDTEHGIRKVLSRLNALSKTELVQLLMENRRNVLTGVGHLGEETYEVLKALISFFKSDQGHSVVDNAEDIVQALNKFHTAKRATQVLHMILDFGSRTLNIDVLDDDDDNNAKRNVRLNINGSASKMRKSEELEEVGTTKRAILPRANARRGKNQQVVSRPAELLAASKKGNRRRKAAVK